LRCFSCGDVAFLLGVVNCFCLGILFGCSFAFKVGFFVVFIMLGFAGFGFCFVFRFVFLLFFKLFDCGGLLDFAFV